MGTLVRTFLAILLLPALAAAGDGLRPPAGEWVARGGSPSHSAVSSSRPLRGPVHAAWEREPGGGIEGEPLVHRSRVIVSVRTGREKRKLCLLRLTTGEVVAEKRFPAPGPLLASASCGLVAVRTRPTEARVLSLAGDRLDEVCRIERKERIHDLLFHDGELYLRTAGAVERFDLGGDRPVWRAEGAFRGEIALAGAHLYVVDFARAAGVLVLLSRASGERVEAEPAGFRLPHTPAPDAGPRIAVDIHRVAVCRETDAEGVMRVAEFSRKLSGDRARITHLGTRTLFGESVEYGGSRFEIDLSEGRPEFVSVDREQMALELADPETRPEMVAAPLRPARSGGVVYLGARAMDLEKTEILWGAPFEADRRAVPAGDFLFLVRGGSTLVAFTDRPEGSVWVAAALYEGECEGTLVFSDGTVFPGTMSVDLAAGTVSVKERRKECVRSVADIAAAFAASGSVIAAAGPDGVGFGLVSIARAEVREQLALLALDASRARDPDLTGELISRAIACGADLDSIGAPMRALERLRDREHPPNVNERYAEKTREKAEALVLPDPPGPEELLALLPREAPAAWRLRLIRRLLAADPENAAAAKEVREHLPEGVVPPDPFDASEWIDFVEVARRTRVRVVGLPEGIGSPAWRPDPVALRSEQLRIVTPLRSPGRVARCLALGELVCDTLEGFFAGDERDRASRRPLTVCLFESREEYTRHAAAGESAPLAAWVLSRSAGYYSPAEGLSRFCLPEDEEAFRRVMRVFVHELTHQWIAERYAISSPVKEDRPGFWIAEGIATFVEDIAFDVRCGTWGLRRYARDAVAVAAAPPEKLIPWPKFYALDQAGFSALDFEADIEVPAPRKLADTRRLSQIQMFYAQAAATVLYLFEVEGGRYREALMRFIGAWYRGEAPKIRESFGVAPAELGRRVLEHARTRTSSR